MKAVIYVEGESDQLAFEALFSELIQQKLSVGASVNFIPLGGKSHVLMRGPIKAVDDLIMDPTAVAALVPDLYPKDHVFPHETSEELKEGLKERFRQALEEKISREGLMIDQKQTASRFKVFCLKYELETLILAAENELKNYLEVDELDKDWKEPVEDHNHDNPPKKTLQKLFANCKKTYRPSVHAPAILKACKFTDLAKTCDQQFKPFVKFLEKLPEL